MSNTTNHEISLQEAIDMTTLYRQYRPSNFPVSEMFEKDAIDRLLSVEGCANLRIYLGMKEDLQVDTILVAANADGEDILPSSAAPVSSGNDPIILEDGYRCPDDCPQSSPLNG
ncbi:MAG TPA: hypothetical protein VG847_07425 [Chitinophagaceae bacterium]|nr:hypothetical protein [Chitinophagaceae bacterium]